ncbi:hypothetical protein HFN76_16080 [Rhizobium laguerreae]|uniref:hypothetical protein n=1 Tax=Rhizobium laguerreae TaxID=1076926 RepID=UPI001C929179|nr:hypothetical protein [Rhizobium laguerreae]MBY3513736.1 hypothetical protein [Rhizobium laguerreae]
MNNKKPSKTTEKARLKVKGLLDFLRHIQTTESLESEIKKGFTLNWEGLRGKAGCGSDALHKNNPDLKKEVDFEKLRLETLASHIGKAKSEGNVNNTSSKDDDELRRLKNANKRLDQENKNLRQQLNGSHLTNVGLLTTIANLEQELRQLKHFTGHS